MRTRVEAAIAAGKQIPRFDSETGQEIPLDCLRTYRAAYPKLPQPASSDNFMTEAAELSLELLAGMKRNRREDQIARAQTGLPPR